jgi:hypothetical protein
MSSADTIQAFFAGFLSGALCSILALLYIDKSEPPWRFS